MNSMNTPICDFVKKYSEKNSLRLHVPGHKGKNLLGFEKYDITELEGADSLYEAYGIIAESEKNASTLFGCDTFYSTEGSSQCIRSMCDLICRYAKEICRKPLIAAARNVHKTFLSAAALLDFEIEWLFPEEKSSYLSCSFSAEYLDRFFSKQKQKPIAFYLTSPDYTGKIADIAGISEVCRKHGVLLAVDAAHGAYMRFLPESRFPTDLGADICCSSAHKTLPALTGAAYLHISSSAPELFSRQAKNSLALFGSTSPSYLILQSLDALNNYLTAYPEKLAGFIPKTALLKAHLEHQGYSLFGDEALKLTICPKSYGYRGHELAQELSARNIFCEFADPDFVVLTLTPELCDEELKLLENALLNIPKKTAVCECSPQISKSVRALSVRDAMLSPSETVSTQECKYRILAAASVSCPPAVPILVSGEVIDKNTLDSFNYYGIKQISIVK